MPNYGMADGSWVSAYETRNWFKEDPLLDWLNLYGEEKGFVRDDKLPSYDPRTDFGQFIMAKGREFERCVIDLLQNNCKITAADGATREERALHTGQLIEEGVEAIYQGTLIDSHTMTYGKPDLIVRSDVLCKLCECAPEDIGDERHYRIVDIKFTTVKLTAKGYVGNENRDRMAQLFVYNRALGALQGFTPKMAYIIGRTYKQREERVENCLHQLAAAEMTDLELAADVDSSVHWMRKVREEGSAWNVLPEPSNDWLRPNMVNGQDSPWHQAKKRINEQIFDHSSLWQVTPKNRPRAIAQGVYRYDDPNCCASLFGLSGDKPRVLQLILDSQKAGSPDVAPQRILTDRENWHAKKEMEFYVDFETVSDVDDKFDRLPHRGGQPLIFMIGCGHEEEGEWKVECFICDRINEPDEAKQIDAWIDHMITTSRRFGAENATVFHWSPHEKSSLTTAFNAARVRHPGNTWPEPNWYDFLNKVVKPEPVTVKGSLTFGLKSMAKALVRNGHTDTNWGDSTIDGLGAMVGAWWCDEEAEKTGRPMIELDLMKEIRDYNEVDCKVMWEAISYFRKHH